MEGLFCYLQGEVPGDVCYNQKEKETSTAIEYRHRLVLLFVVVVLPLTIALKRSHLEIEVALIFSREFLAKISDIIVKSTKQTGAVNGS